MTQQELPPNTQLNLGDYEGVCTVFANGEYIGRHDYSEDILGPERVKHWWSTALESRSDVIRLLIEQQRHDKRRPILEVIYANQPVIPEVVTPAELKGIPLERLSAVRTSIAYDGLNIQWTPQHSFLNTAASPMDTNLHRLQVVYSRDFSQLGRVAQLSKHTGTFVVRRASPKVVFDLNAHIPRT